MIKQLNSSVLVLAAILGSCFCGFCICGCGTKPDIPDGWNDDVKPQVNSEVDTSPYAGHEIASVEPIDDAKLKEMLAKGDDPNRWRSIQIEKGAITDEGVAQLVSAAPLLEQLVLRESDVTDVGALAIAKLNQLRIINMPNCQVSDEGIAKLVELPKLEFVRLGSANISDHSLELLRSCKTLKFLHLIDAPISDKGLETFVGWNKLESLYLDGSQVTGPGVARLVKNCPDLHLHLDQKHHDSDPRRGHHK